MLKKFGVSILIPLLILLPLASSAAADTPLANPIANPSAETAASNGTPTDWISSYWGANDAAFSYANDGHTDSHSLKTQITSYTDGDAKWYFTPLRTLTPGGQYSFSAWYKTNTQPHVVVDYTDAANADYYFNLTNPLPSADSATTWQQYNGTFDVPTNATSVTVFFLISSAGWLQTDDFQIAPYTPVGFSEPIISLTFDDGWLSIYTNGLQLLQQYNLVSTQYIISGLLNTSQYMTTAMVQAFQSAGSEIASHTVTHPDLTQLNSTQLATELGSSQTTLRQLFGSNVAADFATPYGTYNGTVLTATKQYYQSHRSTDAGFNSKDNFDPYNIRVQNVETDTTPAEVAAWVAKAKADKAWLVLVFHQVSDSANPDDYAVSPANLNTELANIKASGVQVETISQALAEINNQLNPPATVNGDVNGDSTVDALDLSIVLRNWGKTATQGDVNGDGTIDALDLSTVLVNWSR